MWWNVFDRWGNKVGEIHERDSDPGGCGCFLNTLLLLIIGLGSILIWPIMLGSLFSQDDAWIGVVQLVAIILVLIAHGNKIYKRESYSFWGTWISLVLSSTLISGLISWIVSGLGIAMLFASLFINFLLSIGSGLITAIIIAFLRRDS